MGDVRFQRPFHRVRDASDRAGALRALSDEDVIAALAGARGDPLVANVLATEAANRMRNATTIWRAIGEGVLVTSRDGAIRFANPAAEDILANSVASLRGLDVHDVLHPGGALCSGDGCPLAALIAGASTEQDSTPQRIRRADAGLREVSIAVYDVPEDGGHGARVVTIRDMSDLVRAADLLKQRVELLEGAMRRSLDEIERRRGVEDALRDSERRLAEIVGTIGEGVVILDTAGKVVFYNQAAERIMGTRAHEVLDRSFRETHAWAILSSSIDPETIEDGFQRILDKGERLEMEVTMPSGDGRMKALAVDAVPLRDAQGIITGVLGSVADVSERMAAEAKLVELNHDLERRVALRTRELERANSELETFTRAATHDLKSPLRGITALADALAEDHSVGLDEEARGLVEGLRREGRRATRLVDDLLALSRAGSKDIDKTTVDLHAIAADVVERLRGWHPERQVDVQIAPGLVAVGDPGLLATVVDNLIGNAWKYTARTAAAKIVVGFEPGPDGGEFFVSDNGVGFDPAEAALLFQPFRRLGSARGFEGTGVGLATVARILERHGGSIRAEGKPGEGAKFSFRLPSVEIGRSS